MSIHEPLYSRLWRCPAEGCGEEVWFSYWEIADAGTPICPNCDSDMELVGANEAPARLMCVGGAVYQFHENGGAWGIREITG